MGAVQKGFKSPVKAWNMRVIVMENTSRSQGWKGNRPAGGRLGKTRVSMNKNPIEGRTGKASWHHTAKPYHVARAVNGETVRGRTAFLPGEIPADVTAGKSAAVIVIGGTSRGLGNARINEETGGLTNR